MWVTKELKVKFVTPAESLQLVAFLLTDCQLDFHKDEKMKRIFL